MEHAKGGFDLSSVPSLFGLIDLWRGSKALEGKITRRTLAIVNKQPSDDAFSHQTPHKIHALYRLNPDRPDDEDGILTTAQRDAIGKTLLENLKSV